MVQFCNNLLWCFLLILLLVFCFCFYFTISSGKENFNNDAPFVLPFKVDFVYTWVDFTPEFIQELQIYKNDFIPASQYRDNDELKYSLRSVEMYADWVNHIYIVIKDGQFIPWLDTNHPRITVVYHSEIIPLQYLPTFNSIVIESFLHRIPGLSENYLYINDDILFWNQTVPTDFFTTVGQSIESESSSVLNNYNPKPEVDLLFENDNKVYYTLPSKYDFMTMIYWNSKIIEQYFKIPVSEQNLVHHVPSPNKKSVQYEIDMFLQSIEGESFMSLYENSNKSKFRSNINISRISIFKKYFSLSKGMSILQTGDFHSKMIELTHLNSKIDMINDLRHDTVTKFLNIQNNIEYGDVNALNNGINDLEMLREILESKFLIPSSFELI